MSTTTRVTLIRTDDGRPVLDFEAMSIKRVVPVWPLQPGEICTYSSAVLAAGLHSTQGNVANLLYRARRKGNSDASSAVRDLARLLVASHVDSGAINWRIAKYEDVLTVWVEAT